MPNFIFPVQNYLTITQGYKGTAHRGIDMGWNSSVQGGVNQPIIAAEGGTVVTAVDGYGNTPNNRIYGNYVIVSHNGWWTVYGHLLKGLQVKVGDRVVKGQPIGRMGNSGYSFGQHLHFEIRKGKNDRTATVDPLDYLMLESRSVIVSSQTLYPSRIKYRQTSIGTPVARDTNKNQIEVLITDLNARDNASINADRLGFVTKGIYNVKSKQKAGDYMWYQIEPDVWIAYSENWAKLYPKEVPHMWQVTFPPLSNGDYQQTLKLAEQIGVKDQLVIKQTQ